jgi:hypothetical protein
MLGQPRAPSGGHAVARLQDAARLAALAAAHQTGMTAVRQGQQLHHRALNTMAWSCHSIMARDCPAHASKSRPQGR